MKTREELIRFIKSQGFTQEQAEKRADHVLNDLVPEVEKYIEENYIGD